MYYLFSGWQAQTDVEHSPPAPPLAKFSSVPPSFIFISYGYILSVNCTRKIRIIQSDSKLKHIPCNRYIFLWRCYNFIKKVYSTTRTRKSNEFFAKYVSKIFSFSVNFQKENILKLENQLILFLVN